MQNRTRHILLALALLPCFGLGDPGAVKTREANKLYQEKKYDDALSKYADAQIDHPESSHLYFNVGDAHYRKRKFDEAIKSYEQVMLTTDPVLEAKAHYNVGNCLYRQGKLREALDRFRRAIELTEDKDGTLGERAQKVRDDAKYNHEFVKAKIKEMLKRQKQRQQQQQQGKKKQQQQKKKKEGEQKKKEGEQKKKEQQPKPQSKAKRKPMTKEEAERLLRALENEKKNRKKRQQRRPSGEMDVLKDW